MIRAAFATGDGININRHFGIADRFDIYEIDLEKKTREFVDTRRIDSYGVSLQHDDSLIERLAEVIDDCNIVFSAKSGLHAKQALDGKLIQAVDVERKVEAAKAALKDAAGKLQNAAADATDDLKDVVSAGLKSLAAGWEEAKKTFNQFRGDK